MQQHTLDSQAADVQSTSSLSSTQMQRQQLQVISPARTTVDLSGATRQGVLYQEAMQNLQSPQSFPPLAPAANAINAQQQISDWNGDGRFVQQPVRYSSTLQPVYDFRGQLIAPGNFGIHPANVNQLVQYGYGSPQQRPSQGPVAQLTPWQTIYTPNQGLTWVPGGIQATTIDGQGNQILNRNFQHDSQPGVFIQNGQPQLQQLKQMDGQHASIPKTVVNENFSPSLPHLVTAVNNTRTQQQAQIQALQTMLQSQKVLTKNSIRLASATTSHKNSGYHGNSMAPPAHPLPPAHGSIPGQVARPAPLPSAQESKRMKQAQALEESPRKELMPPQQAHKRYQHIQGSTGSVPVPVSNSIPGAPEGVTLSVIPTTSLLRNMIPESVPSASSTIQILPGTPVPQSTIANPSPGARMGQQQLEIQGDAEHKKRIRPPGSLATGDNRAEEPRGLVRELGKYVEEKSSPMQNALPEVEEIYCEDADSSARSEKDNNGTTTSKATVLVKPQVMTHATEGSFESVSSGHGDCEDGQAKIEVDGKIFEDDDKELNRRAIADPERESYRCPDKQQAKPNLSKWTAGQALRGNSSGTEQQILRIWFPDLADKKLPTQASLASQNPVADVYKFIRTVPGCSQYAEEFVAHDIDGEALMLLKTDHLVTAMSMTLGPAMKIISRIDAMREDTGSPAK